MTDPIVKIRYHKEEFPELPEIEKHGNFYDLSAAKAYILKKGEFALINLGVSMELPEGHWAMLVPRSSTFKKYKIIQTNSIGVIDTSYCGDGDIWKLPVLAMEDTVIPKNARICQFTVYEEQPINIEVVDKLESTDRGGFGSTGV